MNDSLPVMDTDRNLLFAVLALQAGLIDRDRFVQACTLWAARKDRPIAALLVDQGWLTPAARDLAEQLLVVNLGQHGGDAQASLGAATGAEARRALAAVADAAVGHSLAALPATAERPAGAEDYSTVPPGDCAGRHLLYEEIGHGGIGRVLRGRDPELRRDLAVKVLRDEYRDDDAARRRFVEEAQVGGQLQHPGVVPVYELGRFPDRRPYFTMKLVKGRTLAELLKERPDPGHELPRFLTIFEQVCQTMAYAHSKGVVHRDLKPSNVMVGSFGEVQVMDWGLAKVLGQRGGDPEATTAGTVIRTARSGSTAEEDGRTGVVGTPAYMAPEQARGEVEAVDARADVFGLGAILYVLLTGQPPFASPGREEVLRQAAAGDLAEAFGRLDGCGADAELAALCRACLAPRREDRPRDAGDLAARMAAYQAAVQQRLRKAEVERATAQARAEEARATAAAERKARRRTRALAAALLALVAAGAGGALLLQRQARRGAEQRQAVEFALDKAAGLRQQARWAEAQAVLGQARRGLGDAGARDLRRRLDEADAELDLVNRLDALRQRRATWVEGHFDFRAAAPHYAAVFRQAGLGEVGDDEAAAAARVRASGVAGPLVAALDDWALVAEDPESRAWLLGVARRAAPDPWGDRFHDPAVWQDRQALRALADEALRDDGAKLGELSPQVLAAVGSLLGGGAEAVPLLRAAQRRYPNDFWLSLTLGNALHQAKLDEEAVSYYRVAVALRPDAAFAHNNLGTALRARGDLDGAIAAYRRAIELEPTLAFAHNNLGNALLVKGDRDGAVAAYRQAVALDPHFTLAHSSLGVALYEKEDLDGAVAAFQQAITLDPKYAQAHSNLGIALADRNDLEGAIAEYRKAIALDPQHAQTHNNLGIALRARGELAGAVAAYRQAVALDPRFALAHSNLGAALADQGDLDGAIAEYQKAIALDPKHAQTRNNLGQALRDKGELAGAVAAYRQAVALDPRFALARSNLGLALADQGDLDGAAAECRQAVALDPKLVRAHGALGEVLLRQGRFAEARAATRRCLELLPPLDPLRPLASQQMQLCERLLALGEKLPALLGGEAEPDGTAEWLTLAQLCQCQRRHAAAARFYAAAFAADAKAAADLRQGHRYDAACSAALAAAGQGEGAKGLPDKARLMLRRQALAWLRDDLAAYRTLAERPEPAAKQLVQEKMRHWQQDADLAPVRDPRALDTFPDDERQPWRRLWEDVAALLKRMEPQQ
jgi:serine/threonine-protein kinase